MRGLHKYALLSCAIASCAGLASATVIQLDFEGLQNGEAIMGFYNGGMGSLGSMGPNYGVEFVGNTLAIIDSDAGGTGNFGNEPSPDTIMFFLSGASTTMNVAVGFDTGFGIDYTTISTTGSIEVWSGLDGTGSLLGSVALNALGSAGNGDPTGDYDTWERAMVSFAGVAHSVVYIGAADFIGFDDASFGSTVFVVPVPTAAFAGMGLLGAMGVVRRLRK